MRDGARVRIGVAIAAVGAVLALAGGRVGAEPVGLSVSTTTGVAAGQAVEVVVTATPGTQVGVCQALVFDVATQGACHQPSIVVGTAGPDGTFATTLVVRRHLFIPYQGRWVDCAGDQAGECAVGASEVADIAGTSATALLDFADPPAPPATPGSVLVAGGPLEPAAPVAVDAAGFRPGALLDLRACLPGSGVPALSSCVGPELASATADPSGAAAFEVPLPHELTTPDGPGDCRLDPAAPCRFVVSEAVDHAGTAATAPFPAFAHPTLTVTPGSGLVAGQDHVLVEGEGFAPGAVVGYCQGWEAGALPHEASPDDTEGLLLCGVAPVRIPDIRNFLETVADAQGRISVTVRLERDLLAWGIGPADCADPSWPCMVHAFEPAHITETLTSVPLGIVPPPPPPAERGTITVSATPPVTTATDLSVTGAGFRPGALVDLYVCPPTPTTRWSCERLLTPSGGPLVAGIDGSLSTTTARLASTSIYLGPDCRTPGACVIAAAEGQDFAGTVTTAPLPAPPPTAVPGSVTVVEGTGQALVPLTLSHASSQPVTVQWTTLEPPPGSDLAARPGEDFVAASGAVTFAPGETEAHAVVPLLDDGLDEPSELLAVSFTDPVNARMGGFWGLGFAAIDDDDPTPVVLPGSASVAEGDAGTTILVLPVTLTAPSARKVSVTWATLDPAEPGEGFADPPGDFVPASGTVTFPPGATAATVELEVVGDEVAEADELVVVSFRNPANARMGGFWGLGFGGITDDD